jgi:polysaccharide pyruvyl transferase WcaK-like protein
MKVARQLCVLHLASFDGNVGDNANHNGTYSLWEKCLHEYAFEITRLEMREFYWKLRHFDEQFADYVNTFDLFVVGGGNYFELWVEHSPSGTSVALSPEMLRRIKTPTVFYSLGLDPHNGFSSATLEKFKSFMDAAFEHDNYLFSLRNDGSFSTLYKFFDKAYHEKFHMMPDGGFFVDVVRDKEVSRQPDRLLGDGISLCINLAGDMPEKRYDFSAVGQQVSYAEALALYIESLIASGRIDQVVLVPHIYKDFQQINLFMSKMSDRMLRNNLIVAPYLHGMGSEVEIFQLYNASKLVLGNRFHANVCSIGLGVPSIGLCNYPQIEGLYGDLCMLDRCVQAKTPNDIDSLDCLLVQSLGDLQNVKERYAEVKKDITNQAICFMNHMQNWLEIVLR